MPEKCFRVEIHRINYFCDVCEEQELVCENRDLMLHPDPDREGKMKRGVLHVCRNCKRAYVLERKFPYLATAHIENP